MALQRNAQGGAKLHGNLQGHEIFDAEVCIILKLDYLPLLPDTDEPTGQKGSHPESREARRPSRRESVQFALPVQHALKLAEDLRMVAEQMLQSPDNRKPQ